MNKPKIIGIGNNDGRNVITLKKDISFFHFFPDFFRSLGITLPSSLMNYVSEEDKEQFATFERDVSLPDYADILEYTHNDDYEVNLFFGNKIIILLINTEPENRERIIEELKKVADFEGF